MNRFIPGILAVVLGGSALAGTAAGSTTNVSPAVAAAAAAVPDAAVTTADAATRRQHERLTLDWVRLWNGDYRHVDRFIAPDFGMHAALLDGGDGSAVTGPSGLVGLIRQIRGPLPDLHFRVQVGPIIDGDRIVVRWIATGTYAGGFPGATAAVGTDISFEGTDIVRVDHAGRIVEYWLNADTLGLVTQLGVTGG
ncbi:ester cyclase [Nakamurella sp. A5-74]|uniref:Ester cyclase n=1 Tax=Nakamurella sp. A5-74 TaxID=3158264 RepID=A0AAU8DKT5_9ACTN